MVGKQATLCCKHCVTCFFVIEIYYKIYHIRKMVLFSWHWEQCGGKSKWFDARGTRCSCWGDDWYTTPTVGHRRRVTAVTRLPRWRRRKTRLQVRPHLTMLQDMDRCDFLHATRYWIGLTCDIVMFGNHASKWPSEALVFSGGRRVT